MLTDQGLCRVFNAEDIDEIFASTKYLDTLLKHFSQGHNFTVKDMNIKGQGPGYAVRLVLDAQEYMRE